MVDTTDTAEIIDFEVPLNPHLERGTEILDSLSGEDRAAVINTVLSHLVVQAWYRDDPDMPKVLFNAVVEAFKLGI